MGGYKLAHIPFNPDCDTAFGPREANMGVP